MSPRPKLGSGFRGSRRYGSVRPAGRRRPPDPCEKLGRPCVGATLAADVTAAREAFGRSRCGMAGPSRRSGYGAGPYRRSHCRQRPPGSKRTTIACRPDACCRSTRDRCEIGCRGTRAAADGEGVVQAVRCAERHDLRGRRAAPAGRHRHSARRGNCICVRAGTTYQDFHNQRSAAQQGRHTSPLIARAVEGEGGMRKLRRRRLSNLLDRSSKRRRDRDWRDAPGGEMQASRRSREWVKSRSLVWNRTGETAEIGVAHSKPFSCCRRWDPRSQRSL